MFGAATGALVLESVIISCGIADCLVIAVASIAVWMALRRCSSDMDVCTLILRLRGRSRVTLLSMARLSFGKLILIVPDPRGSVMALDEVAFGGICI